MATHGEKFDKFYSRLDEIEKARVDIMIEPLLIYMNSQSNKRLQYLRAEREVLAEEFDDAHGFSVVEIRQPP